MPPRPRRLTETDHALWAEYAKSVTPLGGVRAGSKDRLKAGTSPEAAQQRPLPPAPPGAVAAGARAARQPGGGGLGKRTGKAARIGTEQAAVAGGSAFDPGEDALALQAWAARAVAPRRSTELVTGEAPAGLDRGSWNRFRTGRIAAIRTLDLHGKTVHAAYLSLQRFLLAAHADHVRCVEIITGRGSGETGGLIRRELPHWLNQAPLRSLVLATAHPHAANPGSTRLLLRRAK